MKLLELIPLNYEHIYNTMKYFELEDLSMWQIVLQNFTNPNIIGSWANTVNEHINKANNKLEFRMNVPFIYEPKRFISTECNCENIKSLPRLVSIKCYTNLLAKYNIFRELIWYKNRFKETPISLLELEDYIEFSNGMPNIDFSNNLLLEIPNIYPILPNVYYDHCYGPSTHIALFHKWTYDVNLYTPQIRFVYVYGNNPLKDYLNQMKINKPINTVLEELYKTIEINEAKGILKEIKFKKKSPMYTYENTPAYIALNETQVKNIKKYNKYSRFYIVHYWTDTIHLYTKKLEEKKWQKLYF